MAKSFESIMPFRQNDDAQHKVIRLHNFRYKFVSQLRLKAQTIWFATNIEQSKKKMSGKPWKTNCDKENPFIHIYFIILSHFSTSSKRIMGMHNADGARHAHMSLDACSLCVCENRTSHFDINRFIFIYWFIFIAPLTINVCEN